MLSFAVTVTVKCWPFSTAYFPLKGMLYLPQASFQVMSPEMSFSSVLPPISVLRIIPSFKNSAVSDLLKKSS